MDDLAHSADPRGNVGPQRYRDHVENVLEGAVARLNALRPYLSEKDFADLLPVVEHAALYHDLGKLCKENQAVLRMVTERPRLPVTHWDAGVAHVGVQTLFQQYASLLILSHHRGLPGLSTQSLRRKILSPDRVGWRDRECAFAVDSSLDDCLKRHNSQIEFSPSPPPEIRRLWSMPIFRIALSCLADSDHFDTARHYKGEAEFTEMPLMAEDRLLRLTEYVNRLNREQAAALAKVDGSPLVKKRNDLRAKAYNACMTADTSHRVCSCTLPVGFGKTTAMMAYALRTAIDNALRRVIVVLPFTNIIDQSVDTFRNSIVLPGESPERAVVAHHCRTEFENKHLRKYAQSWQSPVVVTTATQFFETLAANRPSRLRKLHQIVGSVIVIDESHACLPTHLWKQSWKWLKYLTEALGCRVVLGSGSQINFWKLRAYNSNYESEHVPELVPEDQEFAEYRQNDNFRVSLVVKEEVLNCEKLTQFVVNEPGPRIVVMNTIKSAAVLAMELKQRGHDVLHMSTALCARDRRVVLGKVKKRLKAGGGNWTLVATSCVEAGVDLSFRTGFRERCGLVNIRQLAGRVNRNFEYGQFCKVWDFQVLDERLPPNRGVTATILATEQMFLSGKIAAEDCTEAMAKEAELRDDAQNKIAAAIENAERSYDFEVVGRRYKVIASDTATVLVDDRIVALIESGVYVKPSRIQKVIVSVPKNRAEEWGLEGVVPPDEEAPLASKTLFGQEFEDQRDAKNRDANLLKFPPGWYDPELLGYMQGALNGYS